MAEKLSPATRALPIALLRAREAVMSRFRPLLARHGVTEQQWRVLRALHASSPLDAAEISRQCFILPPSLTRIIRTLEERGMINRRSSDTDGRRLEISLTKTGEKLIEKVTPNSLEIYREIERSFGAKKLETLLDQLEELGELKPDEE